MSEVALEPCSSCDHQVYTLVFGATVILGQTLPFAIRVVNGTSYLYQPFHTSIIVATHGVPSEAPPYDTTTPVVDPLAILI